MARAASRAHLAGADGQGYVAPNRRQTMNAIIDFTAFVLNAILTLAFWMVILFASGGVTPAELKGALRRRR